MLDTSHRVDSPHDAIEMLCAHTEPVSAETIPLQQAIGRIIAQPVVADRDSPPLDVSAMDGYAVRHEDLGPGPLPVRADAAIGRPPIEHPSSTATRIYTGAPVPAGADTILPREWVEESEGSITLRSGHEPTPGRFIRRAGENSKADARVLEPGTPVTPPVASVLSSLGVCEPEVHRKLRVSVLLPGDELLPADGSPEPWQIRDGNGPGLVGLLAHPWIEPVRPRLIADDPDAIRDEIREALTTSDVVFLSGGVSAGQRDHVPEAVRAEGGRVLFHGVRQRPGGPMLGAVTPDHKLILALPGNPVSALVCARVIAYPALRTLAGFQSSAVPFALTLDNPDDKPLDLWHHRPVRLTGPGTAALIDNRGSGDTLALSRSDGVVLVPPNRTEPGPWPFYPWNPTGALA